MLARRRAAVRSICDIGTALIASKKREPRWAFDLARPRKPWGVRQGTSRCSPAAGSTNSGTSTPGELTSACGGCHIQQELSVRQRMPENILILADWRLAGIVDDTMPPRDPNGDDEEEEDEEEDEERNDQPPVVREPEPAE
jgi:hypothetical protein